MEYVDCTCAFLQRNILTVASVKHTVNDDYSISVESSVSENTVQEVRLWATAQSDFDTSSWDGFNSYSTMSLENGVYYRQIPSTSNTYFVEAFDTDHGIVTSAPKPIDEDYFEQLLEAI